MPCGVAVPKHSLFSLIHFLPPAHSRHVISEECFIIHRSSTSGYLNPPYQCITPCLYHQPAYPCWKCRGWYSPSRNSNLLKWLVSRNEIVRAHARGRHYHQFASQPVCRAPLRSPALHLSGSHRRAPLRKERRGTDWVGGFSASNSLVTVSRQLFIYLIFNFI